jgi:hypothetical protein
MAKEWGDPIERARNSDAYLGVKWALISIAESLHQLANPPYVIDPEDIDGRP